MKYIIFSDIHLHTYSGEVDKESRLSKRLLIQKNILQQIIDLAIQEDATILFGGDFVHAVGNIPVEVMNIISWFFTEVKNCGLNFYACEGNHDQIIRKNCSVWHSALSPFQSREQRNIDLSLLKPSIRFVDYDQIDDVENIKNFDIVIVHAQPDLINKHKHHMEGVNWKKIAKNNRYVFFGHDHTTRKLGAMAYVIGAPLQLTMNDVGEDRGCWIVDSETWDVQFHKLDYPELKKIEKVEGKEEKFEERIKATSFKDILIEWLDREQKPLSYLDLIQKDIEDKFQVVKNVFDGKITQIHLKDFLSIDDITVEYKNGFWLVLGENGTGKTSLTGEGIYWILFDENTKGLAKQEIVRDRPTKQKEAIGELHLVDSKQFYKICRSSKIGLEIWQNEKNLVDGMTKIQAQDFLENNILGFDKNTYLAACYFSQEQLLTLAQLGDADTTNLVTNLLGFETYDSLYHLMTDKIKEVTLQISELEKSSVNLNSEIWKNNEQQKNIKEQIELLTKTETSLKDEQLKINQQIDEFTTLLGNIVVPSVTTEDIDVSLLRLNDAKYALTIKTQALQNSIKNLALEQNKIDKDRIKMESEIRTIEKSIANHKAVIDSLKENKCVYCGTILKKEELEKHLGEELAEISLLTLSLPVFPPDFDKQLEKLYDQEAEITEIITANNEEISKIDKQIDELHYKKLNIVKEQTEANSRKSSLTTQIKQLEHRAGSLIVQLSQLNVDDKTVQLKKLENDFANLDAEKLCINDKKVRLVEHLDIYNFWSVAFSNKGIRPLLLDKFVNEFNQIVKQYCYEVSGGEFIVEFTPTSKIRSGLERNKLGLQVVYKDKLITYASLSGGEKARCNLPLCLGLNKWISTKYGVPNGIFGLMIFDELFCFTDTKFRENVAQILFAEGKNKSIFVIDHSDTLMAYTSDLWLVTKENDITQLQVV